MNGAAGTVGRVGTGGGYGAEGDYNNAKGVVGPSDRAAASGDTPGPAAQNVPGISWNDRGAGRKEGQGRDPDEGPPGREDLPGDRVYGIPGEAPSAGNGETQMGPW